MNNIYGYGLYEFEDMTRAFNYYHFDKDNHLIPTVAASAYFEAVTDERIGKYTVVSANLKKVHEQSVESIYPYLLRLLRAKKYKCGIIMIELKHLYAATCTLNLAKAKKYISNDMFGSTNDFLYIKGLDSPVLEQMINSKYGRNTYRVIDEVAYIKLGPSDTFKYIYDLMDDFCKYF